MTSLRKLMVFNSLHEMGVHSSLSSTPDSYYSACSPRVATNSPPHFFTPCSEHFGSTGSSTDSNHSSPLQQKIQEDEQEQDQDQELYEEESTIETVTEHVVRPSVIKQLSRTHSIQSESSTAELLEISAAISSPSRDLRDGFNSKRLKLKTVGKLMLPATFMQHNDRNNNCQLYNNNNNNNINNSFPDMEEMNKPPVQKRPIGKIKSVFLDVCQQQAKLKDEQKNVDQAVNQFVLRRKPLDIKQRAVSYHGFEEPAKNYTNEERSSLKEKYANIFNNQREDIENNSPKQVSTRDAINRKLINARALAQQQCNSTPNSVQSKYAKYFGAAQQQQQQKQYQPHKLKLRRIYDQQLTVKSFDELLIDLNITEKDLATADAEFDEIHMNACTNHTKKSRLFINYERNENI